LAERYQRDAEDSDGLKDKLVSLNRVGKGGEGRQRLISSASWSSVTARAGSASVRKAAEAPVAIKKAVERAKKNMVTVAAQGYDPPSVFGHYGAGKVFSGPLPKVRV